MQAGAERSEVLFFLKDAEEFATFLGAVLWGHAASVRQYLPWAIEMIDNLSAKCCFRYNATSSPRSMLGLSCYMMTVHCISARDLSRM
jgi:hypothetical protein